MSDSLVWHLIRDNNAFLHKVGRTSRAGSVQFSAEKGNLMNVNTFKYSGLANTKTIDLQVKRNDKKHRVVLTKKAPKKANRPAKSTGAAIPLTKHKAHSLKVLANTATSKHYRADLTGAAAARYTKLRSLQRILSGQAKQAKFNAGRDSR